MITYDREKEDLETHVSICAERYQGIADRFAQVDQRLTNIEAKMAKFEDVLTENKRSLATVIITSSATIVASLLGLILTILTKF